MKMLILSVIVSFVAVISGSAQKTVSVADLQKNIAALKTNEHYRVVHSEDAGRSLVFSRLPAPQRGTFASPETVIQLNVGFDFQGSSFTEPRDEFVVFFHSLGRRWNFLKDETLSAVIDGQPVDLSRRETDNSFRDIFLNGKRTRESLVFRVNREALEKIVGARKVEINLSDLRYRLEARDLEYLRELLKLAES